MIAIVIAAYHYPGTAIGDAANGFGDRLPATGESMSSLPSSCADGVIKYSNSGKWNMTSVTPPEVSVEKTVTVICPGSDFSNLYESLIDQLGMSPEYLEQLNPPKLLIDMQHIRFIGSAFLGRMVFVHKTLAAREGGRVGMFGMNSFCRAALTVSKLDSVLELFPALEDALIAFEA